MKDNPNKLADAIAKAEQWVCLVCDEPEIERTILVALEALSAHDAEKAKPDGDYVLVPRVPTPDMLSDAGTMENYDIDAGGRADDDHIAWWSAMLAAAPHPAPAPAADGAGELPPLPEPTCLGFRNPCGITQLPDMGIYGYTSDQMRAYARAALAALRQPVTLREVTERDAYSMTGALSNVAIIPMLTMFAALRANFPHGVPVTGNEGEGK